MSLHNVHYLTSPVRTSTLGRHKPPALRHVPSVQTGTPIWSHTASWNDLACLRPVAPTRQPAAGWGQRWTATFQHGRNTLTERVSSVSPEHLLAADPILKNSWHKNKTSRAGLRYVSSTDALHAHASMFERRTLLLLDFHGATSVAAQPFTLTYEVNGQTRHHTPDFMAVLDGVPTVINCRPAALVKPRLLDDVAALGAMCLSRGWENTLVVGYPAPAFAALDAWSAHSTANDFLGYGVDLIDILADGPLPFGDLTRNLAAVAISRAAAQLLLWDRTVSADLSQPFDDDTLIYLPEQVPGGDA